MDPAVGDTQGTRTAPMGTELGYFLLNTAQAIYLCLWSTLWISVALVASLFSGRWPLVLARKVWGPGLIVGALADVQLVDSKPLDPTRNYVFVMNHQSMFDIPVAFALIPFDLRFFAKRILAFVPFLGWYMWRTGMVFVDRSNKERAKRSVDRAVEKVAGGINLLAYPEGTRSLDGYIHDLKAGAFRIAALAGVPVVPVAIEGSGAVLPSGGFRLRPGRVKVRIGEPIETGPYHDNVRALVRVSQDALVELHRSIGGPGAR